MLRVGLTGGIGSGKSTVARRLVRLGATLIDADVVAREVVEPGTSGFEAVVERFGTDVVRADGSLDREALGAIVFADAKSREALNTIVHPLVYQRRTELLGRTAADAIVVEDIPLLVENGLAPAYHLVIVVHAPSEERVRRLVEHRGLAPDDAWARVRAQADDDERRAAADIWLDNAGRVDDVLHQVDDQWRDRLVPYEANIRTRTVATDPDVGPLGSYDDTWPLQAKRLMARIAAAAGDLAIRVDHVGGTSVPGLLARDVIDLLVVMRSPDDHQQLTEALGSAGFPPRRSGTAHGSADPGRPVLIHLHSRADADWRTALLLRDWLHAEPDERKRHNAWAHEVAGDLTNASYAKARREWYGPAVARAERWAARFNWSP